MRFGHRGETVLVGISARRGRVRPEIEARYYLDPSINEVVKGVLTAGIQVAL